MKILLLSAASSSHTAKWANSLSERGHEVHLVYNKGHEPQSDSYDKKIKLYKLRRSGFLAYYLNAKELRKIVDDINPDVINVHYASGYGTLARIAKVGEILLSVWGSDIYEFPYKSRLHLAIIKKNLRYAKMIASTSQCMAEQIRQIMNNPNLDITITPFGIDLELFKVKDNDLLVKNEIVIGSVKSLYTVYRMDILILAFNKLINDLNQSGRCKIAKCIRLEIYGDGDEKENLISLVNQLNLSDVISFKGKIPNEMVPLVMRHFDIFCATSEKESFGVSLVEAMAMELPIVATDNDGFKEVLDNEVGIIVECNNVDSVAKGLETLILDKQLRIEYGKNGREKAEKLYNWNENILVMEHLYYKLCNKIKKK